MSIISKAKPIGKMSQSALWVIYGKSGSGKTKLASTFPKPMLYVQVGDDGSNTISDVDDVLAVRADNIQELKQILIELKENDEFKSVVIDTFSLILPEYIISKTDDKKKMTLQMWGEIKAYTDELVRLAHELAKYKNVVLTCHETKEILDGLEDEILPEIRPSVSKGAMLYLEGMANFGIHTVVFKKDEIKNGKPITIFKYGCHYGTNSYYWTKTQKPSKVVLPKVVINPTFKKLKKLLNQEEK